MGTIYAQCPHVCGAWRYEAQRCCDQTVSMMDVYPTLMDLTSRKAPGSQEGESLMRWLKDPRVRPRDTHEWTNLAAKLELAPVKKDLVRWLPTHNEPDAPSRAGGGEN